MSAVITVDYMVRLVDRYTTGRYVNWPMIVRILNTAGKISNADLEPPCTCSELCPKHGAEGGS